MDAVVADVTITGTGEVDSLPVSTPSPAALTSVGMSKTINSDSDGFVVVVDEFVASEGKVDSSTNLEEFMDFGISEVVVVVASDVDIAESTTSEMVVVGVGTFVEDVDDSDKCVNLESRDESGEIKVDISLEEDSSLIDLDDVALVEDVVVDNTVVAVGDDTAEDVLYEEDSKPIVDIVIDEFEKVSIDPEDVTNW